MWKIIQMWAVINFETNVMQIWCKIEKVNQSYTFQGGICNEIGKQRMSEDGVVFKQNVANVKAELVYGSTVCLRDDYRKFLWVDLRSIIFLSPYGKIFSLYFPYVFLRLRYWQNWVENGESTHQFEWYSWWWWPAASCSTLEGAKSH